MLFEFILITIVYCIERSFAPPRQISIETVAKHGGFETTDACEAIKKNFIVSKS